MRLSRRKESLFTRSWSPPQRAVLLSIIGLQAGAFIVQMLLSVWDNSFVLTYLGLSARGIDSAYAWQFFTAPLLHHNVWHFIADLLFLYAIGRDVEAIIGQRQFLFLYIFGALAGEFGHIFFMPETTVLFGATGGVAAVVAAYATLLPELEINSLVRIKVRTAMQLALIGAAALFLLARDGAVAHSAFFGGAGAGWLYAHLLGYGRTSMLQRFLHRRGREQLRLQMMDSRQFLRVEVDPILEKISTHGLRSLSRRERRLLTQAREKILAGS